MGLSFNFSTSSTSKYFRMTVPPNQYYGYYNFGKYTNDTGAQAVLKSITLYLGTGNGRFTAGQTVDGDGGPFALRIYTGSSSSGNYGQVTITNAIAPTNGYPPGSKCVAYKFSFNHPVTLNNGAAVQLWWECQDRTDTKCLCLDADRFSVETGSPNFTVTFNLDGGTRTGGGELVQVVPPGGNAIPPTCSRTGYSFSGWTGSYTNVTSNRTIKAKWSPNIYTVTYDANGGYGAPATQNKPYGSNISLSSATPSKSYTLTYDANGGSVSPTSKAIPASFIQWNTKSDGSGTAYMPGATYSNNASIILYAIYGSGTLGDLPTPNRDNSEFVAWTSTRNGSNIVSASTSIRDNTTIYAKWRYRIVFNSNGGIFTDMETGESFTTRETYKDHGATLKIPEWVASYLSSDEADSASKAFKGYSTSSSGSAYYQPGDNFTTDAPTTLYAIYGNLTYTVEFLDGYSGTVLKRYTRVPHGSSVVPPPDPKRKGYTFSGWLGDYSYVISDRKIQALWGITPIWIMSDKGWIRYQPREV